MKQVDICISKQCCYGCVTVAIIAPKHEVTARAIWPSHSLPTPVAHHRPRWASTWLIWFIAERQEYEWCIYVFPTMRLRLCVSFLD